MEDKKLYDPSTLLVSGVSHLVTALILFGNLIPASIYVSIEIVNGSQAFFINRDNNMYEEETCTHAQARTLNLNEELGVVDTILCDRTGTLTCNQMDFLKCSIAGIPYGMPSSQVEVATANQMAMNLEGQEGTQNESEIELEVAVIPKIVDSHKRIKGFSFEDNRPMNGNWAREPNKDVNLMFFRIHSLCHTAVPELNEAKGTYTYRLNHRMKALFLLQHETLDLSADNVIFDCSSENGRLFEEANKRHLNEYAEAGLRTLAFAYRKLEASEYSSWNEEFMKAKTCIGGDRDSMLERLSDSVEKDLVPVGATAVEDKLQPGVPQCIDKLAQAGLKIWVLTGDKMETTINIGFACSLLRQGMRQICIKTNVDILTSDTMETLTYALEDDLKHELLNLAIVCHLVICCRVSPKQKALVTRLVKEGTGKTTLAIGDGANDVGRIQEADIGVAKLLTWQWWGPPGLLRYLFSQLPGRLNNEPLHMDTSLLKQVTSALSHGTSFLYYMICFHPTISFAEALAPAPLYWLSILLAAVACNVPYFAHMSFQILFDPMDHHVIQEIKIL
ncbi:probable phospholipid-transporting ATPase 4 [Tanacetum coccineum]